MAPKRTIIRVETNRLSIIRPAHAAVSLWCEQCATTVPMVTPERAAQPCGLPPRVIYRLVENSEFHFIEANAGELFIAAGHCSQAVLLKTSPSQGLSVNEVVKC